MSKTVITSLLMSLFCCAANAQLSVETDYVSRSDLHDNDGNTIGRGDMLRFKGRLTIPLSVSKNAQGQVSTWALTAQGAFATLSNETSEECWTPDKIVNASINVSHSRPLSERWRLIASLGAGVYASPDEIAWRSVLANGAVIFAYRMTDNLSVGVGAGLTNAYGVPMVLPMGYLSWNTGGQFKIDVNMSSGLTVKASAQLTERFSVALTAIDIDGMSAVRRIDGKNMIYSTMLMKSMLCPTLKLSKHTSVYAGIGGTWLRTNKLSKRSLKGFFESFKSDDDSKQRFMPTMQLAIGLKHNF